MQSVIQVAKEGDIMHGITASASMTDVEMRALDKMFVKKQKPENNPMDNLAKRMQKLESMLMVLLPEDRKDEFLTRNGIDSGTTAAGALVSTAGGAVSSKSHRASVMTPLRMGSWKCPQCGKKNIGTDVAVCPVCTGGRSQAIAATGGAVTDDTV